MPLIGALLTRPDGVHEVDVLPEHFESAPAQVVYKTILEMSSAGEPIDVISVGVALQQKTGKNWMPWLGEAYKTCPVASHAGYYADQVRTGYTLRQAREIANKLSIGVEASNSEDMIDQAIAGLMNLRRSRVVSDWSGKDALAEAYSVVKERMNSGGRYLGIPSGLRDLDAVLGGFQETDLITVAARSGMGKTAFMLNLVMGAGVPVGIISSEQGYRQIGERLYAIAGKVDTRRMRTGDMDEDQLMRMVSAMSYRDWEQVRINDKPNINIFELARQAREWSHKYGIKALYVDYIQRIQPVDRSIPRREQVDEVVVGLKNIARELKIPVIALAQVNRSVESRADPRPNMSDLKESGKIEEESDIIMSLFREDYYDPETERKGIVEVDILKNRHGPVGCIDTVWKADCLRFESMMHDWQG
jgi:replicative DNA helicase